MAEGSKSRLALDLDQIERQLRQSSQPAAASKSDPLAELARIVGQDDPFRALLADPAAASQARAFDARQPGYASAANGYAQPGTDVRHAPAHAYQPAALGPEDEAILYGHHAQAYAAQEQSEYYAEDEQGYSPQGDFVAAAPRRPRRRLMAAAVLGLAVLGGGAGFYVWRGGDGAMIVGGEPPVIKADAGPSKVPPLNPGGVDIPNQNNQIYERDLRDSQTRVVSSEEQPIDVRQIGRGPGSPLGGIAGASGSGGVADVLGEPRRVKTVSIRPDGAIIGADPAPAQPPSLPAPAAPAREEPLAAPSVPSTAAAMAQVPTAAPLSILPPQRPRDVTVTPSSSRVGGTPSSSLDPQQGGPLQITPDLPRSRAEPRVAGLREPTETSAAPTPSAGGFDVQVGVKSSENEARAAFDQLQQRYPIELSGFSPLIRQAESHGKTIYRMRVGPMPREEAVSLCSRLKAANGQCFVAAH
jgi:hypothetical protein